METFEQLQDGPILVCNEHGDGSRVSVVLEKDVFYAHHVYNILSIGLVFELCMYMYHKSNSIILTPFSLDKKCMQSRNPINLEFDKYQTLQTYYGSGDRSLVCMVEIYIVF